MRDRLFTMRITDSERQQWIALAAASGLTLADLVRNKLQTELVGRQPIRRQKTRVVPDTALLLAVARCGNNLNQLARWANRYKPAANALHAIAALVAIERQLSAALDAISKKPESEA